MSDVAFYAVYRDAQPQLLHFLRQEALKSANLAIGVDIMFLRQSQPQHRLPILKALFWLRERWRDICWYTMMISRGHIIVPFPALISLIEGWPLCRDDESPPSNTVASLYSAGWPNATASAEIMATYIRFVASPSEAFGLRPYNSEFLKLLRRWRIYSLLLDATFLALKPRLFISPYSGYLHYHTPCDIAIRHGIPTLVMGCGDRLYRISDKEVPRQFEFANSDQVQEDQSFLDLSERGTKIMQERIKGAYDPTIGYMKDSAYKQASSQEFWSYPEIRNHLRDITDLSLLAAYREGFLGIFMHEFNDWHHNGVLPPFATSYYEWLLLTIAFLYREGIPYVVKIHPCIVHSPKKYSSSLEALINLSSQIGIEIYVTTSATTIQLIEEGMRLGVTVRGTVALELAYLRTPFMCAGRPPYAALFPRRTVADLEAYRERLLNYKYEPHISKEEADFATYYVASQERDYRVPYIKLARPAPLLSSSTDYLRAKALL